MSGSYSIDRDKWSKLDIFNQMGNIYSEVGRSINARKSGNDRDFEAALGRAIDLFDATTETLVKQRSPKAKEVLRSKEQFLNLVTQKSIDPAEASRLDQYFLQFAVAARIRHSASKLN